MNHIRKQSISKTATQFSSSTSMHGFSHLPEASATLRTFWICIIAIAVMVTTLHLTSLLHQYLRYDSYESVKNEQKLLRFPDITLCRSEGMSDISLSLNHMEEVSQKIHNLILYPDFLTTFLYLPS